MRPPGAPSIADWTRSAASVAGIVVLATIAASGLWLGLNRVPLSAATVGAAPTSAGEGEPGATIDAGTETSGVGAAAAPSPAALAARIDINTATQIELESLPGIGPALAQRIIADRERFGPFATPESLTRVKGIGPKTLERLRPLIRAAAPTEGAMPAPMPAG